VEIMAKQEIMKVVIKKDSKSEGLDISVNTNGTLGDVMYGIMNVVGKMLQDIPTKELKIEATDSIIKDLKALKKEFANENEDKCS
jgi:hypothetical protein